MNPNDKQNGHGREQLVRRAFRAIYLSEQNGLVSSVEFERNLRLKDQSVQIDLLAIRHNEATDEIEKLRTSINSLIASNRGGTKGVHGFIGERAQVYLRNARASIEGEPKTSFLIDDNGMVDYMQDGVAIQQKACRSNGLLGLDHILRHKIKYPEFNGVYQIPKDFYREYFYLKDLDALEAGKLNRHDFSVWKEIQKIQGLNITVEPMDLMYDEIQRETIGDTIRKNADAIEKKHSSQMQAIIESHKPTMGACLKTMTVSSALEGFICGVFKAVEKKQQGKGVKSLDKQDVKDVVCATVKGSLRGAVRGGTVYLADNYTRIPGLVANSAITVAFDSARAAYNYKKGLITGRECVGKMGKSIVVSSAGAFGAKFVGKMCPLPVVGEVVGSFLFSFAANKACESVMNAAKYAILNTDTQPA